MKNRILILLLMVSSTAAADTRENCYDVLAKMLAPFTALFSTTHDKARNAMTAEITVVEMTGMPQELAGTKAGLALAPPDKLRVSSQAFDELYVVCRNGQNIWVLPGLKFDTLLGQLPASPPAKANAKLGDFTLPVPEKELVFLPALFHVSDGADETVNGTACRVLNATLIPEVARSLNANGWSARAWVGANYKPVRLELNGPQWHAVVVFNAIDFLPSLPPETWKPSPEQTDVLQLNASQFWQLLYAAGLVKDNDGKPEARNPKQVQ